mmetsp:Transcript_34752/g.70261  ORF Transcript_34752/g.70261 Transcript_34752/m.70261 type:complete len:246 (+) Transcript_34752:19-756(+)
MCTLLSGRGAVCQVACRAPHRRKARLAERTCDARQRVDVGAVRGGVPVRGVGADRGAGDPDGRSAQHRALRQGDGAGAGVRVQGACRQPRAAGGLRAQAQHGLPRLRVQQALLHRRDGLLHSPSAAARGAAGGADDQLPVGGADGGGGDTQPQRHELHLLPRVPLVPHLLLRQSTPGVSAQGVGGQGRQPRRRIQGLPRARSRQRPGCTGQVPRGGRRGGGGSELVPEGLQVLSTTRCQERQWLV